MSRSYNLMNKILKDIKTSRIGRVIDVIDVSDEDCYKFMFDLEDVNTKEVFTVGHDDQLLELTETEAILYGNKK